MNEKFFALPEEKQKRIINAGLEIFAKYDYKNASTDDIAAKAGIAKGLLFYYFKNKTAFYIFLIEYTLQLTEQAYAEADLDKMTDYFDLMEKGGEIKVQLTQQYPCLIDFSMRAYYSEVKQIAEEVFSRIQNKTQTSFAKYFMNVDYGKFKPEVSTVQITKMLTWMGDGYLNELRKMGKSIVMDEVMEEYRKWTELFRKMSYREEYINGEG